MMRFLGFLVLLALGVGAWGRHAGWFTFASSEHDGTSTFTVDFHQQEFGRDLDYYGERVHAALAAIDAKLVELRTRARTANAKSRPKIDDEIRDLEQTKDTASESLRDLETGKPEQRDATRRKLDKVLQEHGEPAGDD